MITARPPCGRGAGRSFTFGGSRICLLGAVALGLPWGRERVFRGMVHRLPTAAATRARPRRGIARLMRWLGRLAGRHMAGRFAAASALALALAGCQSAGPEEVLEVAPALPAPAQETVGTGPVMVAMLLARNAGEPAAGRARDFFDGASLAVKERGGGALRVTVYETGGDPATARFLAEQAIAAGARMIVGPADAASLAQVATIPARERPPILALTGEGGGNGIFAFTSDAVDSALEGVRVAVGAGQSQVLLLLPEGFSAGDRARLEKGVAAARGKLVGTIVYPRDAAAIASALRAQQPLFARANAAAIFGDGAAPSMVARTIATSGLGGTLATLIGNAKWQSPLYSDTVLDGALVALPDQDRLAQISGAYRAAARRPLSLDAATAYDAVALAAGLVRVNGPNGLTLKALTADSGFRGATGLFRLRRDGSVERRHTIYRIENGKLVELQGQGDGF